MRGHLGVVAIQASRRWPPWTASRPTVLVGRPASVEAVIAACHVSHPRDRRPLLGLRQRGAAFGPAMVRCSWNPAGELDTRGSGRWRRTGAAAPCVASLAGGLDDAGVGWAARVGGAGPAFEVDPVAGGVQRGQDLRDLLLAQSHAGCG